jgi:HK97 family phage prohead protease
MVADPTDNGKHDVYREGFRRGAFDGQVLTGGKNKGVFTRIGLIHKHEGGLGYLGPFTHLREGADGLYGTASIVSSKSTDVADLLDDGIDELSIEFRLRGAESTIVDSDGVRWRTSVHLDQVALEPKGAYSTAQVLQYRAEMDALEREELEAKEAEDAKRLAEESQTKQLEDEAAAVLARRAAWDEMTARIDRDVLNQRELERTYGVMQQRGYRRIGQ